MRVDRSSCRPSRPSNAFTLVELLVVIGIIALLIAVLLPAPGRAREQANMLKCLATLRNMAQAAHAHAAEHQGFMPVAGRVLVKASPALIGDANRCVTFTLITAAPSRRYR